MPSERRATAERMALAQLVVINTAACVVEEAMSVLLAVMRHGEKDSDRLKAVDRVLELSGIRQQDPIKVEVNVGLRPAEDVRDARLIAIIEKLNTERAELLKNRAIEAIATESA